MRVAEIDVNRSRFIATLGRADSQDEARSIIADVRHAYPDARHHCSAFIVDQVDALAVERSNDDGEPSGTAGTPMLEALRGSGLTNVVCVVTRYFGGVLLGTGGLARAYGDAVHAALDGAPRVDVVRWPRYRVRAAFSEIGRLQQALLGAGSVIEDACYDADAVLVISAPTEVDVHAVVARVLGREPRMDADGVSEREVPLG